MSDRSEKESFDRATPVRSDDNQVGPPTFSFLNNHFLWGSLKCLDLHVEIGSLIADLARGFFHVVRGAPLLLLERFRMSCPRKKNGIRKERERMRN